MADSGALPGIKFNPQTGEVAVPSADGWAVYGRDKFKVNPETKQIAIPTPSGWQVFDAPQSMLAPAESRTTGQEVTRQLGLTAKDLLKGASYPITAAGDLMAGALNLGAAGINKVAGTNIPKAGYPGDWANAVLDANFPSPENRTERVVNNIATSVASVPSTAATLAGSGVRALAPMAEGLGMQAVGAATGTAAQQGVHELAPGHPFLEFLASLGGSMAGSLAASAVGTRAPVDAARAARYDAQAESGITPSAPDVTQSKPWQLARTGTSALPFVGRIVQNNEQERLRQAQQGVERLVGQYGEPAGPAATGEMLQSGVTRYRYGAAPAGMTDSQILRAPTSASSIAAKSDVLYNRIPIQPDTVVDIPNTMTTLQGVLGRFNNPQLAAERANPVIQRWQQLLTDSNGQLTWNDLRQLRSDVRYMRNDPSLNATIDDRTLQQLNQALSQDMVAGANAVGGPRAAQLVSRADQYYGQASQRVRDNLQAVFKAPNPESAFFQAQNALLEGRGGDIGKIAALKRALTDDEWGDFAATTLDRLGRPPAGNANIPDAVSNPGPQFSINSFMTNYSKMSPAARSLLFNGTNRGDLRDALDSLSLALGSMKGTEKMSNPSRSAEVGAGLATLGGMASAPGTTLTTLGLGGLTASAMYNPTFVRLTTRALTAPNPRVRQSAVQALLNFSRQNPDNEKFIGDAEAVAKAAAAMGAMGAYELMNKEE